MSKTTLNTGCFNIAVYRRHSTKRHAVLITAAANFSSLEQVVLRLRCNGVYVAVFSNFFLYISKRQSLSACNFLNLAIKFK